MSVIRPESGGQGDLLSRLLVAIVTGGALGAPSSCGGTVHPVPGSGGESMTTGGATTGGATTGGATTGGATSGGTGGGDGSGGAALACSLGTLAEFCVSRETMERQARIGYGQIPMDPPRSDSEVEAGWDDNGCMRHDWVGTGCCNPAERSGTPREDGSCCYLACEGACCGRPLLVFGRAQVAGARTRTDWLSAVVRDYECTARDQGLSERARAALADSFRKEGLMEHASVASFARFGLQLLALGAPPDLVLETTRAMGDEVRHTEICFAIARALDGKSMGPAELQAASAPLGSAPEQVLEALIVEGCVGETISAAVVWEQAERAEEPSLARDLKLIARDEARHTELAWRAASWMLMQGDASLTSIAKRAFTRALARPPQPFVVPGLEMKVLNRWGRLSESQSKRAVDVCVDEILTPAIAALFERLEESDRHSNPPGPPCQAGLEFEV